MALGLVFLLVGLVWVLQGLDVRFAPKSFMTGQTSWTVWGASAMLAGLLVLWWDRKSR